MSGHSKWATTKHAKAIVDAKRGQAFTKMARLITVAVKKGSSDPTSNPLLRMAIEKAKEVNMPNDNIKRAIDRGLGKEAGAAGLEEMTLEGYGPFGVAFLVEVVTDNRNRTISEVRNLFSRYGGNLGEAGSAAYVFTDREHPTFEIELDEGGRERVTTFAQALSDLDDVQEVYTNAQGF